MVFFKPLILLAGAYFLYSYFRGDGRPPPPPPPPPPRPRSPSPRRGLRYSSPAPAHQTTNYVCRCDACQRLQHRAAENVSEHQRLSSQNLARHLSQTQSSPAEPYRSQDHQYPKIEPLRNAQATNEDDQRDPRYLYLRSEAKKYYDLMAKSFDESKRAYSQRERARAKELSNQGQEYKKKMENFNAQASDWIFEQNNKGIRPYTVDLHGLYASEAVNKAERSLNEARARNDPLIKFIVGKGLHSKNGNAKLKPEIEKFIRKSGLFSRIDQSNLGVLIVDLDPALQMSGGGVYFRDRTNLLS